MRLPFAAAIRRRRVLGALASLVFALAILTTGVFSWSAVGATNVVASDSFNRTVTSSWGTADIGGAWSVLDSPAAWSVTPGEANISAAANAEDRAVLPGVSIQDVDLYARIILPQCTSGANCDAYLIGRYNGGSAPTYYRVGVVEGIGTGNVLMRGQRSDGSYLWSDLNTGIPAANGVVVDLRVDFQGVNPTTVHARAWKDGTAEPTTWLAATTDGTSAEQIAGAVGVRVRDEDPSTGHTFSYLSYQANALSTGESSVTPTTSATRRSTSTPTTQPKSSATATATHPATSTPNTTSTPTPMSSATATATHPATSTPIATSTPKPTASATAIVTATPTATPGGGPDSAHLIRSVNDSLYDATDQLMNDTTTQSIVQQHNTPLIRMPFRDTLTDAQDLQALTAIQNTGAAPLVIVHGDCVSDPYTIDNHWLSLVAQVFPSGPVYVEYGNEEDLSCNGGPGISAQTYLASWNSVVSQLKANYPTYKFIGPVNYQTNPSYIATFVAGANPQPDFISWHEYVCSTSDSNSTCLSNIGNWATHVSNTNAAVQSAIGHTIPIMITEWNLDPFSDSRYSDQSYIQQWTTSALAEWSSLTGSGVYAAFIYTLESHSIFQIIDGSDNLTPQGAVFFL